MSASEWRELASRKIFFGHQSVGGNVMAGVRAIVARDPAIPLRIVSAGDAASGSDAVFVEGLVGRNGDPRGKTAAFARSLAATMGTGQRGIALHKYCYVDVDAETSVERLFADYRAAMARIRDASPHLTLVHVTMPLTVAEEEPALRRFAKRLLGRRGSADLNLQRNRFNRLLRTGYAGREPIFDLARIESTDRAGREVFHDHDGERVYSLAPEWTYDGGHLNEDGRERAAEELLVVLASVVK